MLDTVLDVGNTAMIKLINVSAHVKLTFYQGRRIKNKQICAMMPVRKIQQIQRVASVGWWRAPF